MTEHWDEHAEQGLLGAMMLSPAAITEAAGLKAHHFYRPSHGIIFNAIERLKLPPGEKADAIRVSDALGADLETCGGRAYVSSLPQHCVAAANAHVYKRIIIDHARVRRLSNAGQRILDTAANSTMDANEKVAVAESAMLDAINEVVKTEMRDVSKTLIPVMAAIAKGEAKEPGITTGFKDLNVRLAGLRPGKLIVIAARPGIGKSTLALNIAEHAARAGSTVGVFSMEMTEKEVGLKLVAAIGNLQHRPLVEGDAAEKAAEWARYRDAWSALSKLKGSIVVNDQASLTMTDVRANARHLARTSGLDVLIVDYLQLMQGGNPDNRNAAISEITRAMKVLAGELNIPILLLSQMNRSIESRKDRRPLLSDLRDSGSIEQDADVVIFIHREDVTNPNSNSGEAELIVAKNRDGEIGSVLLGFVGGKSKFVARAAAPTTYVALGTSKSLSSPEVNQ